MLETLGFLPGRLARVQDLHGHRRAGLLLDRAVDGATTALAERVGAGGDVHAERGHEPKERLGGYGRAFTAGVRGRQSRRRGPDILIARRTGYRKLRGDGAAAVHTG
jgi:hypothetical protein